MSLKDEYDQYLKNLDEGYQDPLIELFRSELSKKEASR